MSVLLDIALVACVALVAIGAGLIYLPAGLIVGGLLGALVASVAAGVVAPRREDRAS